MPKKLEETKEAKAKKTVANSKQKKDTARQTKNTKNTTKKISTQNKTNEKTQENIKITKSEKSTSTVKSPKSTTKKARNTNKKAIKTTTKKNIKIEPVEYYDLPFNYNQTVVKVLAQTPKTLFVYWEISESDKENFKKQYGKNFFETSKPVLIVHNKTLNYSFEVEINDFANSWYLHINDAKSDYEIELGRRKLEQTNDYIYVTTSNNIESPNDHILFDKSQHMVYFRNVKTNVKTSKNVSNLYFIRNMGKIYNIYDLYKKLYKDEDVEFTKNPSSKFK